LADGVLDADEPILLEDGLVVLVVDAIPVDAGEEIDPDAVVGIAVEIVVLQVVETELVEPLATGVVVLETKTASPVDGGPISSGSPHSPFCKPICVSKQQKYPMPKLELLVAFQRDKLGSAHAGASSKWPTQSSSPEQQTSAIAFPSLIQVSAVGQQNDPKLHFVVLAGQFVADSAQPPAVGLRAIV